MKPRMVRILAAVVLASSLVFLFFRPSPAPATNTVTAVYWQKTAPLPEGLRSAAMLPQSPILLTVKEWASRSDYHQMRDFLAKAPHQFVLRAPGHADISLTLDNSNYSCNGDTGNWQAYGAEITPDEKAKMAQGVPYHLAAVQENQPNQWKVLPNVSLSNP